MTPAERDEVRRIATWVDDMCSSPVGLSSAQVLILASAVLRYVPPGDAVEPSIVTFAVGDKTLVSLHLTGTALPAAARRLAHALHAAADAAEES